MKILSIQTGHNATAGLIEDGTITALLSQEKLDNIKNSAAFPSEAIRAVLRQRGLSAGDIDEVAIASHMVFPEHCRAAGSTVKVSDHLKRPFHIEIAKRLERGLLGKLAPGLFAAGRAGSHQALRNEALPLLRERLSELDLADRPQHFVEHHLCHARAAYHALERERGKAALIFTLDGMGDGLCATVTQVSETGEWTRIAETPLAASLGSIYSETTRFLGMKVMEHEYKVMGLAAYCKGYQRDVYERLFKPVITLDPDNDLVFRAQIHTAEFFEYLKDHAVGERFDNLAGAAQMLVEDLVTRWIANAIGRTGIRRVFTGGGVFMNVKLNMKIMEMPEIEQVFFLPSCGDESNPIGAAYHRALAHGETVSPMDQLYLGLGYSDAELAAYIDDNGLAAEFHISRPDDIEERIAELLAEREVVARFSGPCEWGARSLGNRAILAHPAYFESFYTVNDQIKARDFWMPFAPSVLDRAAATYLADYDPAKCEAPYMIVGYHATTQGVTDLRAAMHQGDFSIRPQVVKREANPGYYRLIEAFARRTGIGGVLNTSFNLHGYPLVATPDQALMTLRNSGLKHLALGPFLLSKHETVSVL